MLRAFPQSTAVPHNDMRRAGEFNSPSPQPIPIQRQVIPPAFTFRRPFSQIGSPATRELYRLPY